MGYDERHQKLLINIANGQAPREAALGAGYSDSFSKVNVYRVVSDPKFKAELEQYKLLQAGVNPGTLIRAQQLAAIVEVTDDENEGLNERQRLFRDYFLGEANFVGWRAAQMAGYSGDRNTLNVTAHELKKNPKIAASIELFCLQQQMGREELLARTAKIARGRLTDVINDDGIPDLKLAKERGVEDTIKKLKTSRRVERGKDGSEVEFIDHEIEIRDSLRAQELLGKHHRIYVDGPGAPDPAADIVERQELVTILECALNCALNPENYLPEEKNITPPSALSHILETTATEIR